MKIDKKESKMAAKSADKIVIGARQEMKYLIEKYGGEPCFWQIECLEGSILCSFIPIGEPAKLGGSMIEGTGNKS